MRDLILNLPQIPYLCERKIIIQTGGKTIRCPAMVEDKNDSLDVDASSILNCIDQLERPPMKYAI